MASSYTTSIDMLTGTEPVTSSAGVSSNTVGTAIDVSLRENLTVQFICTAYTSGDGNFYLDGSNDGTNWVLGIAFLDVTSTTPTTLVNSKVLGSKTSAAAYIQGKWKYLRCHVDIAGVGTYSAFLFGS